MSRHKSTIQITIVTNDTIMYVIPTIDYEYSQ